MNGSRKPNRPMPTGAKNEEGRPQGQPSSEHCSAEACDRLHWQHIMRSTRYLCFERAARSLDLCYQQGDRRATCAFGWLVKRKLDVAGWLEMWQPR